MFMFTQITVNEVVLLHTNMAQDNCMAKSITIEIDGKITTMTVWKTVFSPWFLYGDRRRMLRETERSRR